VVARFDPTVAGSMRIEMSSGISRPPPDPASTQPARCRRHAPRPGDRGHAQPYTDARTGDHRLPSPPPPAGPTPTRWPSPRSDNITNVVLTPEGGNQYKTRWTGTYTGDDRRPARRFRFWDGSVVAITATRASHPVELKRDAGSGSGLDWISLAETLSCRWTRAPG